MDIVIVSQYLRNIEDLNNNNSRFVYLAKLLAKNKKNNIEIITSDFSHSQKNHFSKVGQIDNIKITVCHEPGYQKNVSLKRFYSHYILSKNLKKYLKKLSKKPDIIYCSVPSLSFAQVAAQYAKKNNIKFIIDIQDLWPEAFKMVFKIPIIKDIIFLPLQMQANYIYKQADTIIAVSETYVNRAATVNKKCKNKLSVFLGTELKYFDECKEKNKVIYNDNKIRLVYIGTLGHSYDLTSVMDALKILKDRGYKNLEFIIMGDGPLKEKFELYAKENQINCTFTGQLKYPEMVGKLCACDITVNPIVKKAAQSIINKVGDYAAAGLPVISTQECQEYRNLVDNYKIGYNCKNNDSKDIADKIELLIKNKNQRKTMGQNNRKLAEEKFNREATYNKILKEIKRG